MDDDKKKRKKKKNSPDSRIKCSRPESKPLADILQEQIALHLALQRNLEHTRRDITPDPVVSILVQDFPTEARAAPDVEDELGLVRREGEQFDRAVRHFRLNGLDSCAG